MTLPLVVRNKSDFKEYPYQIGSARDLQFCYNFSNLPSAVFVGSTGGTPDARVVYLADGTKVASLGSDESGLVYRGRFVYRRASDGAQSVESVAHDEGRMLAVQGASGTEFIDTWHVRDYLGSVRAVYDITQEAEDVTDVESVILEQNDYYAFGGRIDDPTQPIDQENRYRFNGKEQLRFDGIGLDPNLTDYGARYYESRYARWTTPDPLADKYHSTSPYAFCNNNPVNFVDPDGKDGIYINFPDYKINVGIQLSHLGHSGILLIENKTGLTKYYEYGRYDDENMGIVRNIRVSNVVIGEDGMPTEESLNIVLKEISDAAGHGGRIEGAYVKSDEFHKMNDYAQSIMTENDNTNRESYSLIDKNCSTFAEDVLRQDPNVKTKMSTHILNIPNVIVKKWQEIFIPLEYNP